MSPALLRWLKKLPPWESNTYFQRIRETAFQTPTVGLQLCAADPNRVALIFCGDGSGTFTVTTNASGTAQGMTLSPQNPNEKLTHADFGPLVSQAWYCATSGGPTSTITVFEVLLRAWPGET